MEQRWQKKYHAVRISSQSGLSLTLTDTRKETFILVTCRNTRKGRETAVCCLSFNRTHTRIKRSRSIINAFLNLYILEEAEKQVKVLQGVKFFVFGQSLVSYLPRSPHAFSRFPVSMEKINRAFCFLHLNLWEKKKLLELEHCTLP